MTRAAGAEPHSQVAGRLYQVARRIPDAPQIRVFLPVPLSLPPAKTRLKKLAWDASAAALRQTGPERRSHPWCAAQTRLARLPAADRRSVCRAEFPSRLLERLAA